MATIPTTFKISYSKNNEINKIYTFVGNEIKDDVNLTELFKTDNKNKIFKSIFSQEELDIIEKDNIPVKFCNEKFHIDDTIQTIKKKIIMEFDTKISFEEVYLFYKSKETFNLITVYKQLTQNDTLELTKDRLIEYLLNIDGIDISSIPNKDVYTYDDILSLNIDKDIFLVNNPIGQKLVGKFSTYPYTVNPFDVEKYDAILENSADKLISTSNESLLLNYNEINLNMIYLCLADDVLTNTNAKGLSDETTIKLYYPFLFNISITSLRLLEEEKETLLSKTKKLIDKNFIKRNKNIDLFYDIYYERKDELNIVSSGIKNIEFIIHPLDSVNLPIDSIFKQIHATKTIPLIKYNPSIRQEKMYRLYSDKTSTTGKKMPFLNKGTIFKLTKLFGKKRGISLFIQKIYNEEIINIECEIEINGDINVKTTFKNLLSVNTIIEQIKDTINPIILFIKKVLEQGDSALKLFDDFNDNNIEIINVDYQMNIPIKNKINLKKYINCISSIFAVYEGNLEKGITMRYKKVAYYNEVDSQYAFIIELINKGYTRTSEIIEALKENFNLTDEEASIKFAATAGEIELIQNQYQNKKIKVKNNPGFLTTISLEKFTNNIIINVSKIDNLQYLYPIHVYIDTLIRLTQDPNSTNISEETIKQTCKSKTATEEKKIQDIIAAPELPYKDNQQIDFQAEALVFEELQTEEKEVVVKPKANILDLLFEEEEEEEEEIMEGGSPSKSNTSDDLELSDDEKEQREIPKGRIQQTNVDFGKKEKEVVVTPTEDVSDITGMTLNKPNPFFRKLESKEPTLFLTNVDKEFKAYSRACPYNNRRQPVILTDTEKEKIDALHPGSYTEAVKYGTDPNNKNWYICPRYWDLKRNVSLTDKEVKSGKYGKVIPFKSNKVSPGSNIYEFTDDKYHMDKNNNYINLHPGFLKDKVHPQGLCVPCCFKSWNTPEQTKRRDQCLREIPEEEKKEEPEQKAMETEQYIKGPEKFPLELGRWGYLPIAVQKFLRTDNKKCYISNTNTNLKQNTPCLLRYGVEINKNQSFVACMANVFLEEKQTTNALTIKRMKQKIIEAVDLDLFISLQNGNLINTFENNNIDVIIENYKKTEIYKALDMRDRKDLNFMTRAVSAYETFIEYIKDDETIIDHKYLWDIISMPNPKLFTKGLNLIIMELERNDITDNIRVLCPSNHYSGEFFNSNKYSLLLLKIGNFYEPIYTLEDKVREWEIKRIFNLKSKNLLPNLRNTLDIIKSSINEKCHSFSSMPTVYKFKTNIILNELLKQLGNINYTILYQVINYNGKIIGVVSKNDKNINGFIPCYPSASAQGILIKSMDEPELWNNFQTTMDYLLELSRKSSKKIPCLPKIKVLEDGLIIGIITETNQFISISHPEQNTMALEMPTTESSDFNVTDKIIMTTDKKDEERIKYIKYIKIETEFYNAFRNTIRILLSQFKNKANKNDIEKIIKSPTLLYTNKLKKIIEKVKTISDKYIEFVNYSDEELNEINEISTCIFSENCDTNVYCKVENKLCKIKISKTNLINGLDNQETYYGKIADELVRYNRINLFMLHNSAPVYRNVNYRINDDEIILLQSLLTQEYFDEFDYEVENKYSKHNSYDNAIPNLSVSYSNVIDRLLKPEQANKYDEVACTVERAEKVGGKLKNFFPNGTVELIFGTTPELCSFGVIETIINDYDREKLVNKLKLKEDLIEEYEKYKDYLFEIVDILIKQGKQFASQVIVGQITIQDMIMSENYYATNLDIWILAKKYNIPLIFLSATSLMENNDYIFVANSDGSDKYYFIKSPGISNLKIPKYRLFVNTIAKMPLINFNMDTQAIIRTKENELTLNNFIEKFTEKKVRKPKKGKAKLKLILEELNEPLKEKPKVKKIKKKVKLILVE